MFEENTQLGLDIPEIQAPEVIEEAPQEQVEVAPQPKEESAQARNFRAIKEKAERLERERNEALRYAEEIKSRYEKPTPQEESEFRINPDDLADGKHILALENKYRKLEEKLKKYEQQSSTANAETRIQSKYPDFYKVVTHENLATFAAMYPELAKTIDASSDVYSKAVSAYELIKRFNITDDATMQTNKDLITKNLSKPRPAVSSTAQGDSPLTRANAFVNGLTPELKAALRKEMQDAMNQPR